MRRADVVILTAIRLEFDAILKVDAGAVPGSMWEEVMGPNGMPIAFRQFVGHGMRPLRVAVAVAPDMGATAATNTLLPLVEALKPRCIAMCGVCAGRPSKTNLGDVVAEDRTFYHDTGKQRSDGVEQDLTTYKLRDDWKAALEGLDVVANFRDAEWFKARPLTTEAREHRALVALRDGEPEPWKVTDPTLDVDEWKRIVGSLRERQWLAASGRELTDEGRRMVDDLIFKHMGRLPDLSSAGTVQPFRLHVDPIGSGTRVIEDETIWTFISQVMRKALGLDMESAALGELAHRQRQYQLDTVVMKGVMDFADKGRDDHFKEFAARASAECLLWFLRGHVRTEVTPGFDDLLTPGTSPSPSVAPSSSPSSASLPSFLLNARHAVVPWHEGGRSNILEDLDAWADDASRPVAVRLLHAEGGIGKTRLAIEWVRRRRERHDVAGFLVRNPDSRWLERLCGLGPPVLVVVEYAESRADLIALLERVAAFAAATGPRRRVRVLLLARGDGDWWSGLRRHSGAIGALLEDSVSVQLSPLAATVAEREAVFVEASKKFAEVRGHPAVLRPPISLDDERFGRVLYLHMAALAAVEGVAFDAGSLMDAILDHEQRFWVSEAAARHSVPVDVALARQLVAAATLRGGLSTEDEARELCARLARRGLTRDDEVLITLLHYVYERAGETRYLPGLEPDLLGEAMVLRVAAPPKGGGVPVGDTWIQRVLVEGDDAAALTTAFTVLGRASATAPVVIRPWIANLLCSDLPVRAVLALRAAKIVGQRTALSILGDLLAEALDQRGSAVIALDLEREEIPRPTVSLMRVAVWQSRTFLEQAPQGDATSTTEIRARLFAQHGADLAVLGHHEAAYAATHKAVELYRTLRTRNPDVFQRDLAACLNNLGNTLSDLGQRETALVVAQEAVDLRRALAARNPDEFQSDFAASLSNLGNRLSDLGRHEAALAATREALGLYRTLATRSPNVFQPDIARSFNSLGASLNGLGQYEAALAATREAVGLYRRLATRNPDAFQHYLAGSLDNLSIMLSDRGEREAALSAVREAESLYRTLAMRNPDAFQPRLAAALNNLGSGLSDLGQREAAFVVTREAVDLYRSLVTRNLNAFQPQLAGTLNNLGSRLLGLGQREAALTVIREAVALHRKLAEDNPDAFEPDLASSLTNLGNALREPSQREAALAASSEAADRYRTIATRNPDAFQPALALSLGNLGAMLSDLARHEAALMVTREAVDLYRTLVTRNPDTFRPALASTLNNLGSMFRNLGQHGMALVVAREAVDLYRMLAMDNPEAVKPNLANSLDTLGNVLSDLGQRETALETMQEAADLIWPFFERLPRAHVNLTGMILRATRSFHEALGRELSSIFIEREDSFAGIARTLT